MDASRRQAGDHGLKPGECDVNGSREPRVRLVRMEHVIGESFPLGLEPVVPPPTWTRSSSSPQTYRKTPPPRKLLHRSVSPRVTVKFSVLLPTRNRLDLLKQAIETVRRQDYADWEI